jgi:transposase
MVLLFLGDDWAEDHHDVELQDAEGRRLGRGRLPEGVEGITRLHALIGGHIGDVDPKLVQVVVGIETERGMWVQALIASGYEVYPINPLQAAHYRTRCGVSGAKSDGGDAHVLADMVRTDRQHLRQAAGDTPLAEAVKVLTRGHKTLIWERTRHLTRLRQTLLDFFPAAVEAYPKLPDSDALELLTLAADPAVAAKLTDEEITTVLRRARRRGIPDRVAKIQEVLRRPRLDQPPVVAGAHAVIVRSQAAILTTLNTEIKNMGKQVEAHFGQHPDVEIYRSQPGLGSVLGARVLAEFGDDPTRYANAKARKNYAGTSPITRQSGKKKTVLARYVHNDRLLDSLGAQAFSALSTSPGARAYYDKQRARGVGHRAALRQLGNRLVGLLHGCLKTCTVYDENTAWTREQEDLTLAA